MITTHSTAQSQRPQKDVNGLSSFNFACITLGCKVNQYETHALREAWLAAGHSEVTAMVNADYILVNSCAVTAKAVADVRSAVSRAHRAAPRAAIIVTGCAAQAMGDELATLPGVSLVVPQETKTSLKTFSSVDTFAQNSTASQQPAQQTGDTTQDSTFPAFSVTGYDRSRAVLKIQDGCSHRCTYCIVPLTRGPSRSRPATDTVAEAKRLLEAGFCELVVNGVNLSQYGRDVTPQHDFWDLLQLLEKELAGSWQGKARLRLSSLEPGQLGDKALETLAASKLVAPHLHLSLQSGSPAVLRRMGRGHYTPALLEGFFQKLGSIWPLFGLGADILTGFPGETDEHAAETFALCQALPFSYAHVFPYSKRPGTPAATWPGQVAAGIKKERAAALRDIFAQKKQAFSTRSLQLPVVYVAREGGKNSGGANEYYSDCIFTVPPSVTYAPNSLVPARPVRIGPQGKLEVLPV